MTETICPTCGAKCEAKVINGVVLKTHQKALPQPDLTKLREAFRDYINTQTIERIIIGFRRCEKCLEEAK